MDGLWLPFYNESIWQISTSINDQMFNGRTYKESFQYSMEYYSLKEEIRVVLSFREYCTIEIHKLLRDPYCGTNLKMIAHMVDEVCKEVETRRLPPGTKGRGKKEDSSN